MTCPISAAEERRPLRATADREQSTHHHPTHKTIFRFEINGPDALKTQQSSEQRQRGSRPPTSAVAFVPMRRVTARPLPLPRSAVAVAAVTVLEHTEPLLLCHRCRAVRQASA